MRTVWEINDGWLFAKDVSEAPALFTGEGEPVTLPAALEKRPTHDSSCT